MSSPQQLHLEVVTPKGNVVQARADSVTLTSKLGEISILPGHIDLIASLDQGPMYYLSQGKKHEHQLGQGILHVQQDIVRVVVQTG